uniref:Uncharacterized protein n=1 Tax=Chenopodium quinoa TaxID=63459 RepID=A0A803LVF3_CHEQI
MERAQRIIEASDVRKIPLAKVKRKPEDIYQENRNRKPSRVESGEEGFRYNADRREIYMDIENKSILPKPNPMDIPIEQRNKKLWCEYHLECGRRCYVDSLRQPEASVNQEDKGSKPKVMEVDESPPSLMSIYMAENPKQYGRLKPTEEDESIPLGKNLDP